MKESISGKKLLILGGAFQHCKVVEAAKRMGVITYVTDYLDVKLAPAKQIADKWFMYDINDIDAITNLCITEEIDGAIALSLDACQRPYQKICEKLGYPCFGTEEQYYILTDKNAFKKCCTENGVDTIPKYSLEDVLDEDICNSKVTFPIIIKPADSRGSRGQTVCDSWSTIKDAIEFAQKESNSKDVVIEKYMGNENDFSMTYIMIEGDAYLLRTDDRHLGSAKDRLDRLAIVGISPSRYAKLYSENVEQRVVNMLKNLGLKNAPVFMQGFVEGDTVRFYDPGLRFPGGEYERMYEAVYGINIVEALIYFSLLGYIPDEYKKLDKTALLNGMAVANVLVTIKPGLITRIKGLDEIRNHRCVVSVFTKYDVGDIVGEHYDVNQRFCEIDIVCRDNVELKETIDWIYNTLEVLDNDENLVFGRFDTNIIDLRNES